MNHVDIGNIMKQHTSWRTMHTSAVHNVHKQVTQVHKSLDTLSNTQTI